VGGNVKQPALFLVPCAPVFGFEIEVKNVGARRTDSQIKK
jgi:hypothetical protein